MTRWLSAFLLVLFVGFAAYLVVRRVDILERGNTVTASALPGTDSRAGGVAIDDRRRQLIGVRTVRVARGSIDTTLRAAGTVAYAEPRLIDVNLKVDGWVTELFVHAEGDAVKRGQPLFRVFSPELLAAQNELIAALVNRDVMLESKAENAREFSARVLEVPKRTLTRLDVSADQIQALEDTRQVPPSVEFRAQRDGVIIEKSVVPGKYVAHGQTLLQIADLSEVWIEAAFPESDAPFLRTGADATVTFQAWPGQQFHGHIDRIYPRLAEPNRKIRAIVALGNPNGRLRLGMYADVAVATSPLEGLLVPSDAIVESGDRKVVFVAEGAGRFQPRDVTIGRTADGYAVVVRGLRENDEVVSRAAFFVDSESNLAASLTNYGDSTAASSAPAGDTDGFGVSVITVPDPPRKGKNRLEVRVFDAERRPVTDAEVQVLLSMPPMPAMNMPAMRSEARLIHEGAGVYSGPADITMAGRWDVSVKVLLHGRPVATSQSTLLAQ